MVHRWGRPAEIGFGDCPWNTNDQGSLKPVSQLKQATTTTRHMVVIRNVTVTRTEEEGPVLMLRSVMLRLYKSGPIVMFYDDDVGGKSLSSDLVLPHLAYFKFMGLYCDDDFEMRDMCAKLYLQLVGTSGDCTMPDLYL
jgi:hypothetical protein